MNRLPVVGAALVLALVFGGLGYGVRVATESPSAEMTTGSVPGIDVSMETISEEKDGYSIEITYPHFGMALDAEIDARISERATSFRTFAQEGVHSTGPAGHYVLDGKINSIYVSDDFVSVLIALYMYTGGAHGIGSLETFNFDRANNRSLELGDALKLTGLSLPEVSTAVVNQLEAKMGDAVFPEGAEAKPENYQSFVISDYAVTFIFQEYQVAAYAAGPQKISFPRVARSD